MGKPVGFVEEHLCNPTIIGDFSDFLKLTGAVGSDGSGGPDTFDSRIRMVSSGAVVTKRVDGELQVAFLFPMVPGTQTVPRAELWALRHVLNLMEGLRQYTVYIDAQYVLNGLQSRSRHYSQGSNGDLW